MDYQGIGTDINSKSIGKRVASGVFWLVASRLFNQVIALLITAILARLLTPADFGLVGMAMTITSFIVIFNDFGTGMAIVQSPDLEEHQLSSIFWLNILIGATLSLLTVAASPIAAKFYYQEDLKPLVSVMGAGFLINSFGVVQDALFRRKMQFNILVKISLGATILAGIAGILSAVGGLGVWSLIIQFLFQSLGNVVLLWAVSSWRPRLLFLKRDIRGIVGFSINLTGFNLVNYIARNADYMLIGRELGSTLLGYYTSAYRLMLLPVNNLSSVASQALYPTFSRLQAEGEKLSNAYIKSSQYIALLTFPIMVGMSILSEEIIHLVYGPGWDGAIIALQLLSLVGTFQPLVSLYGTVILAQGYSHWYFRWGLIVSSIMVVSFAVGLRWGINGVAAAYLIAQILVTIIGLPILFRKGGTPFVQFVRSLQIPGIAALGMGLGILVTKTFLHLGGMDTDSIVFILCFIVGLLAYGTLLLIQGKEFRFGIKADIKMLLSK